MKDLVWERKNDGNRDTVIRIKDDGNYFLFLKVTLLSRKQGENYTVTVQKKPDGNSASDIIVGHINGTEYSTGFMGIGVYLTENTQLNITCSPLQKLDVHNTYLGLIKFWFFVGVVYTFLIIILPRQDNHGDNYFALLSSVSSCLSFFFFLPLVIKPYLDSLSLNVDPLYKGATGDSTRSYNCFRHFFTSRFRLLLHDIDVFVCLERGFFLAMDALIGSPLFTFHFIFIFVFRTETSQMNYMYKALRL